MNLNNNYHSLLKEAAENYEHAELMGKNRYKNGFKDCLHDITLILCDSKDLIEALQAITAMTANVDKIIKGKNDE